MFLTSKQVVSFNYDSISFAGTMIKFSSWKDHVKKSYQYVYGEIHYILPLSNRSDY